MRFSSLKVHGALLAAVNLWAHFLPFERLSLSIDSLARLTTQMVFSSSVAWKELTIGLGRPIMAFFHYPLLWITDADPFRSVLVLYAATTLLTAAVYVLLRVLLEDARWALVGALFYVLIPNKLEIYHTLDFANAVSGTTTYVASFLLFALFLRWKRPSWLGGSMGLYTLGLFWYELGFFLPVALFVYALWKDRRRAWTALLYLGPALFYTARRLDWFGWAVSGEGAPGPRWDSFSSNLFGMLPHLYGGRQMGKGILYGLYRFPTVESPWIWFLLVGNIVGLVLFVRWLRAARFSKLSWIWIALATVFFFVLIAPALLTWGVMGRNTVLSSIAVAIGLMTVLSQWPPLRVPVLALLLGGGLFVCQGNAWSQVSACRLNHAIAQTLQEHRQEVLQSDRVLIDQYSFSQKIPYTWVNDPNNQLDTYWGVTGLLGRGFPFLVHAVVGQQKPVEVIRSPVREEGPLWIFKFYNRDTYRLEDKPVPRQGTFLVDYERVYPKGHRAGRKIFLRDPGNSAS